MYEETTGTLLCGDLFTAVGEGPELTEREITGPALQAEDLFGATCLTPATGPTIRALAELRPTTLGLMHGPAFVGDCAQALRDLADAYGQRLEAEGIRLHGPVAPTSAGWNRPSREGLGPRPRPSPDGADGADGG
jgi:hypothetical protein